MPLADIPCAQCTQNFTPKKRSNGLISKTCSKVCAQWFRCGKNPGQKPPANESTTCPQCSTVFTTSHDRKKFCSTSCAYQARTAPKFSNVRFPYCLECSTAFRAHRSDETRCSDECKRVHALRTGRRDYLLYYAPIEPHDSICIDCAAVFTQKHGATRRCGSCTRLQFNARHRDYEHRRRANMQSNGPVDRINSLKVYARDNWQCHLCGQAVPADAHYLDPHAPTLDHVIPLARGGTHTLANVKLAHRACNTLKGVRIITGTLRG